MEWVSSHMSHISVSYQFFDSLVTTTFKYNFIRDKMICYGGNDATTEGQSLFVSLYIFMKYIYTIITEMGYFMFCLHFNSFTSIIILYFNHGISYFRIKSLG